MKAFYTRPAFASREFKYGHGRCLLWYLQEEVNIWLMITKTSKITIYISRRKIFWMSFHLVHWNSAQYTNSLRGERRPRTLWCRFSIGRANGSLASRVCFRYLFTPDQAFQLVFSIARLLFVDLERKRGQAKRSRSIAEIREAHLQILLVYVYHIHEYFQQAN